MKWTTLRLLGAFFAMTLIAAACGSDTADTTTDSGTEAVADDASDDDAMDESTMDDDAMSDDVMDDDTMDEHDDDHGDDHSGHAGVLEVAAGADVPAVEIALTPTDTDGLFDLTVTLTNFTITPENVDGDPIDNEGHMHLLIDGEKVERFTDLERTVSVPEGEHLVEVELNANNHLAYAVDGEPIRAGLTVTGAGEAMAMDDETHDDHDADDEEHDGAAQDDAAEADDDDHEHDHGTAVGAIEDGLTIDDADVTVMATIVGGEVSGVENRTQVPLGSVVAITVISDSDDEIHLHGYDILDDVPASDLGLIIFTADTPGRFELELEQAGTFITELEIS